MQPYKVNTGEQRRSREGGSVNGIDKEQLEFREEQEGQGVSLISSVLSCIARFKCLCLDLEFIVVF